jgi:hypothetical protein
VGGGPPPHPHPPPPGFFFIAGFRGITENFFAPAAQKRYITVKIGVYRCTPVPVYRCTPLPVYPYTPFVKKFFSPAAHFELFIAFFDHYFFRPWEEAKKKIQKNFRLRRICFSKIPSKIFQNFQNFPNFSKLEICKKSSNFSQKNTLSKKYAK